MQEKEICQIVFDFNQSEQTVKNIFSFHEKKYLEDIIANVKINLFKIGCYFRATGSGSMQIHADLDPQP
jgi:hypothetical protein